MIDYYVNEIHTCLKNRCWFAALSLTLMLPDICGEAEYPNKQVGERMFNPWVGKIIWSRKWQPTPVFLPGKFCG